MKNIIEDRLKSLKRRLQRFQQQLAILEDKHVGKELNFTYWGGFDMGNVKGKINEIENEIDFLEQLINEL